MKSSKGTPWFISLSAIIFTTWNGYLQGAWHAKYASWHLFFANPLTWIGEHALFYCTTCFELIKTMKQCSCSGIGIFAAGMFINIQSDSILRGLRQPGDKPGQYHIPKGGLFNYVSGANFFGEIVEWAGFALAARTIPAFAFFVFTACNIGPRAWQHHL